MKGEWSVGSKGGKRNEVKKSFGLSRGFFIIIICLFVYLFKSRNTWGFIYFINIY